MFCDKYRMVLRLMRSSFTFFFLVHGKMNTNNNKEATVKRRLKLILNKYGVNNIHPNNKRLNSLRKTIGHYTYPIEEYDTINNVNERVIGNFSRTINSRVRPSPLVKNSNRLKQFAGIVMNSKFRPKTPQEALNFKEFK